MWLLASQNSSFSKIQGIPFYSQLLSDWLTLFGSHNQNFNSLPHNTVFNDPEKGGF